MDNPVAEFYDGRDVFVTGGSGLMGKVLLEKLLRSCHKLQRVFVLLRAYRGKSAIDRLEELKKSQVFDRLKAENLKALDKLIAIPGDITELGLGLSDESKLLMTNVSIIYHVAATVRFEEKLKDAIILNIRGTREALNFALELKKFERFVHVSTAYTYPYRIEVDEKIYDAMADWKTNIKMAEKIDSDMLNTFTHKILGLFPNTYTYTKHLAEQVVNAYSHRLPTLIVRPSVVSCSLSEPYTGWCDKFVGIMGFASGTFSGVIRACYCDPAVVLDVVPLDDCIKLFICLPWLHHSNKTSKLLPIYNAAMSQIRSCKVYQMIECQQALKYKFPFDKSLWIPKTYMTKCLYDYYLRLYIFQILPAILMDLGLKLFGKKPALLRVQRMIHSLQFSYAFFLMKTFIFRTSVGSVMEKMQPYPDFRFYDYQKEPMEDIIGKTILGCRRYLLHESDDSIPQAVRKMKIMKLIDFVVLNGVKLIALYYVLRRTFVVLSAQKLLGN